MKHHYRITEDDFVAATKLSARLTPIRIALVLLVLGALALLAVFGGPVLSAGGIAGLVSGSLTYLAIRFFFTPYSARRNYRKYPAMHQKQWLELTPEGLAGGSPIGQALVGWEHIIKWRENDEFVLVYVMPRMFYIVKKVWAEEGVDVEGLRKALGERVGRAEVSR